MVLFLNALYHARHPLLVLENIAEVTGERLILETHTDLIDCDRPVMIFYPGSEFADDPTNWWGPNTPLVEAMLHDVGFRKVKLVYETPRVTRVAHALCKEKIEGNHELGGVPTRRDSPQCPPLQNASSRPHRLRRRGCRRNRLPR